MEHEKDQAVVLKQRGSMLSLVSKTRGRIEVYFFPKKYQFTLCSGSIVSYIFKPSHGDILYTDNFTVEYVPMHVSDDLILSHSLIELCYFFIPAGSGRRMVFHFVHDVYRCYDSYITIKHKKIVLCKLLSHIGLVPDDSGIHQLMQQLLDISIDKIDLLIEILIDSELDEWISWLLQSHKEGQWCKALPLLLKS